MPHVAFVAMSGSRVAEPRLRALGARLPGLRARATAIEALPSLGLLTLAGMTDESWSRSWHESGASVPALADQVLRTRPDLVAISSLTAAVDEAYRLAAILRDAGARTVLGGLHATACPDEAERHVDAVCVGEGEPVWREILQDAEHDRLRPRYRGERPFDLATAPLPAYELLGPDARPRYTLQTARGCPFACEFCAASRLLGPFREKPRDRIEAELDAIVRREARPMVELADDNTFAGRRAREHVLEPLQQVSARWFTESDWRIGERPDLLAAMRAAGCRQVLVGIESLVFPYPGMGHKRAALERVVAAIDAIQLEGIVANGCFVLGADGETERSAEELLEFVLQSRLAEVQITLQTPFPGSALHDKLRRAGRLLPERGWNRYTLFDVCHRPDPLPVTALEQLFEETLRLVFSTEHAGRRDDLRRRIWRRGARR